MFSLGMNIYIIPFVVYELTTIRIQQRTPSLIYPYLFMIESCAYILHVS